MALFRAAETVRPASQRLFADSFAEHFLRPGLRRAIWLARRPALASFSQSLRRSANEYRSLYFGAAAQQMKGYEFYHVAAAHVGKRTEPGSL
jgi:O-methyltransferase involved in polyketide biosynthesis